MLLKYNTDIAIILELRALPILRAQTCLLAEWRNVCGMENDEQKAPGVLICLGGWDQGRLHKGSDLRDGL